MGARRTGSIIACLVLAGLTPSPSAGEAVPAAGRIVATYDAGLAGINLGEFTVTAAYSPSAYEMAADGFSLVLVSRRQGVLDELPVIQNGKMVFTAPDAFQAQIAGIPMGRPGTSEEVAGVVAFLADHNPDWRRASQSAIVGCQSGV